MGILDLLIPLAVAAAAFASAVVNPLLAVALGILVLLFANPLFTVIGYRLNEVALEVTVCRGVCLRRFPYAEILHVRRIRWAELFRPEARWAESLGSNIFRPLVLVQRRGRRRPVIVTPADADAFVAALRARIEAAGPGEPAASAGGRIY